MKTIDIKKWCEEFYKGRFKSEELSHEDTNLLINLTISEDKLEEDVKLQKKINNDDFIIQVINKRLSLYSYKLTYAAKLALGWIFCKSLGNNTMNMTYLQYLSSKYNIDKFDMKTLGTKVFPFGTIKQEFYDEMWDKQKVERKSLGSDNLLDYKEEINKLKF